jgi:hypothetical protein
MPVIDLTRYIVAAAGTWTDPAQDQNLFSFKPADTRSPDRLVLRWAGDFVALTGPLRIRVTVQAENLTMPLAFVSNLVPDAAAAYKPSQSTSTGASSSTGTIHVNPALRESVLGNYVQGSGLSLQASTIYTYTLDIAAGQAWPFSLSEQLSALRLQVANPYYSRLDQLGNNLGYRVIIEPAFAVSKLTPVSTATDLPCDYAVANQPNTASFFPSACEPCESTVIGLPPSDTVALVVSPAGGGCVRTRFFNGMFITREDLETEQRYLRLKSKLHNRASGAGVVWGFAVAQQGNVVCVAPGYGVDCCGNDLTLTSVYQVDVAALLADPALASLPRTTQAQCLNLLLEYVECPSDPRPVHGDPCSPEASRCEMSRIRESVRLRLVPPCDYNPARESVPIQNFLDEVRKIREQFPLGAVTNPFYKFAPFQLRVIVNGNSAAAANVRPSPFTTSINLGGAANQGVNSISIEIFPDSLTTFVRGTLSGQALSQSGSGTVTGVNVDPAAPVDLSLANGFGGSRRVAFSAPAGSLIPTSSLVFKIANWQMQNIASNEDATAPSGDLTLTFTINGGQLFSNSLAETAVGVTPIALAPEPCGAQPCAPSGTTFRRTPDPCASFTSLFSAFENPDPTPVLPWLHTDPTNPARAGDPKALALAALGGWLSQMMVREQVGTTNSIVSTRREILQGIYRVAWLLLFGVPQKADPAALAGALRRLLEGWCDYLLWKGPHCCCDPHGVVIGCVLVEGGHIQKIDPFGGRRYVVHYPMIEHWGAQFGMAPVDVFLTRFFSSLCCISALPGTFVNQPTVGVLFQPIGGGFLAVGEPQDIAPKLTGKVIVSERRVSAPEMITSALALIGTNPSTGGAPQFNKLVLADFVAEQTVILLTPVESLSTSATTGQSPTTHQ